MIIPDTDDKNDVIKYVIYIYYIVALHLKDHFALNNAQPLRENVTR